MDQGHHYMRHNISWKRIKFEEFQNDWMKAQGGVAFGVMLCARFLRVCWLRHKTYNKQQYNTLNTPRIYNHIYLDLFIYA